MNGFIRPPPRDSSERRLNRSITVYAAQNAVMLKMWNCASLEKTWKTFWMMPISEKLAKCHKSALFAVEKWIAGGFRFSFIFYDLLPLFYFQANKAVRK